MKISDTQPPVPVATSTPAKPATQAAVAEFAGDKVSQTQSQQFAQVVAVAQQAQGVARSARLQDLTTAVRNGTYKPDPGQIADSILDDAEVDARLQAMLQK